MGKPHSSSPPEPCLGSNPSPSIHQWCHLGQISFSCRITNFHTLVAILSLFRRPQVHSSGVGRAVLSPEALGEAPLRPLAASGPPVTPWLVAASLQPPRSVSTQPASLLCVSKDTCKRLSIQRDSGHTIEVLSLFKLFLPNSAFAYSRTDPKPASISLCHYPLFPLTTRKLSAPPCGLPTGICSENRTLTHTCINSPGN